MSFRRHYRIAGSLVVLALLGVICVVVISVYRGSISGSLDLVGCTSAKGQLSALFLVPSSEKPPTGFFNVVQQDRRFVTVISKDREGHYTTNSQGMVNVDYLPNGKGRMSVPLPADTSEFSVVWQERVRRGKCLVKPAVPPRVLFILPLGAIRTFESGVIQVTNVLTTVE